MEERISLHQQQWLKAREFAELASVTVRTLHHYDKLGLLKPKRRSAAGYRLYQTQDLERVEQIVALKFLGLPLDEIGKLLKREKLTLREALARQRIALIEKRRLLDRALTAIEEAERAPDLNPQLVRRIIKVIDMQDKWMSQYYSPEAQAKIAERAKTFTPEMQVEITQAWKDYYRDMAALKDVEDPEGLRASELEERRQKLIAAFTGNDPEVEAGLRALYRDKANWPAEMSERMKEFER
ncbi:MAG TPA: MerR family transcriptional regulator [Bryobacteraceae bacterium]|jgi:DNA-binding transcriptional MerR regulator